MKELKTKDLLFGHKLVTNPELITVKAMKKKFVDQVPQILYQTFVNTKPAVIGIADSYKIILLEADGKIKYIHRIDYTKYIQEMLRMKREDENIKPDYKEAVNMAQEEVEGIPQIFMD